VERIDLSPAFSDQRGTITDLLNDVTIRSVGIVTSKAGMVRGNKYHLRERKYIYVMSGKMEWAYRKHGEREIQHEIFQTGDFFFTPPMEEHAMLFLEDTSIFQLTTESRAADGYEEDTVRTEEQLIALPSSEGSGAPAGKPSQSTSRQQAKA
jgi:uncharacterized RmlC-like cupin family protein